MDFFTGLLSLGKPSPVEIISWKGLPVDVARNRLAKDALEKNARYLFMLDADILPPPSGLLRLLSWRLPIVSGLYYAKTGHVAAWRQDPDEPEFFNPLKEIPRGGLVEVDAVGAGCLLVDTRVFQVIPEPWFEWGQRDPKIKKGVTEDMMFCQKAQDHGFRIWVDSECDCRHEMLLPVDTSGKSEIVVHQVGFRPQVV